jgi:hypothetical protein
MLFGYLLLLVALTISSVAAFYSIAGLTAIFAAATAFWPIVIMGSALEIGKVATTVWLHKYWSRMSLQFKLYLVPAIVVLMTITSMGIFGFLSRAHTDQGLVSGDAAAKVAIYDEKIKTARENIEANRRALRQMDEAVEQTMGRSSDEQGADKAVRIRRGQQKERARLISEIDTEQRTISKLNEQRAPLAADVRKVEAEVGPIKYIAAFIYGDNPDANVLEKAVRWVIVLLVTVFDPLALVLILAAEQTFAWAREERRKQLESDQKPADTEDVSDHQPSEDDLAAMNIHAPKDDEVEPWTEQELAALDSANSTTEIGSAVRDEFIVEEMNVRDVAPDHQMETYLDRKWSWFPPGAQQVVYQPEIITEPQPEVTDSEVPEEPAAETDLTWIEEFIAQDDEPNTDLTEPHTVSEEFVLLVQKAEELTEENSVIQQKNTELQAQLENTEKDLASAILVIQEKEAEIDRLKKSNAFALTDDDADNLDRERATNAGFGTQFPTNPTKGDMYLRVDMLPNKLYKWNGRKWIETDRNKTDRYVYEEEYIKYVAEKVRIGEIDFADLNKAEQEEVLKKLDYTTRSQL